MVVVEPDSTKKPFTIIHHIAHVGCDDGRRFLFVVATKTACDNHELPLLRSLSKMKLDDVSVDIAIKYENTDALTTVYNKAIEFAIQSDAYDFVCFIHDDIFINDVLFFDKVVASSERMDVIGVCGGKGWEIGSYDVKKNPLVWTIASRKHGGSGFMVHAADCKQNLVPHSMNYGGCSLFATNYGNSPALTATIDGCLICFGKKALSSGIRFDERFVFHWYDMDICFEALNANLKVGTAPVLVTHGSLGLSVSQPVFMEGQKKFLKKWFGVD